MVVDSFYCREYDGGERRCACRQNMKWNREERECQVFTFAPFPDPTPLLHHHHPYHQQPHPCQIHIGVDCSGFTTESLPNEQIVEAADILEVIF